jgi:DivIVA domain-containing protein
MSQDLTRTGEDLFTQARRGYDRGQVDAYVGQLQQQVRELQAELQRRTTDIAVEQALEQVGNEVADILKLANTTRDGILSKAEQDAADLRREAEEHAAHVTSVAEQRVRELDEDTDRIWVERERMVADARDLSRQLADLADLAAQRFPSDSEEQPELATEAADADAVTADQGLAYEEQTASVDDGSAGA